MTNDQFAEWAQEKMDSCNVFNEIETGKVIVEILEKYFSLERKGEES
ncbi:hypothetical protein [Desulforamulus aquiferis]|uniref:Uncharacterized protein n=1 Tax=Desulforamulus aquiferis TaxID=1397668 RepID=A0AAW7ZBM3_9FIRM|nr:hypothetical protein [Desulforamulus aquiferis]MDO7787082.1 hypothetical protein [Desulforamulus aquiferis]RYD06619.1 hypothetical protein N752_02820 [Desulforamulus aquiferis]